MHYIQIRQCGWQWFLMFQLWISRSFVIQLVFVDNQCFGARSVEQGENNETLILNGFSR